MAGGTANGLRDHATTWRAAAFHAAGALLLGLYGGEVCSCLDGLGFAHVTALLAAAFAVALVARVLLEPVVVTRAPDAQQGRRQLVLDFLLFVGVGVGVAVWDVAAHDFPLVSGAKLTIGCATVGVFAALDGALARERAVALRLFGDAAEAAFDRARVSVTTKLLVPALAVTGLVAADVFLLVNRNLTELAAAGAVDAQTARMTLIREIGFVVLVLFVLTVVVALSFSRNLRLFFAKETAVLEEVASGDLGGHVPVASDDEFGHIAHHTNRMIEGLRERRRVKALFGKLVSPRLAQRILESPEGLRPGGHRRHVTVLFSDVRDFTGRTEASDPAEVVRDLNTYFERMVAIVHAHDGVVDKFIGDGLMAVFGLDAEHGADRAVRAAREMLAAVGDLAPALSRPIAIGIGVHSGDVIAGSIGSEERLEFTFIGDAVNTAARLESLSKDLGTPLVVSAATRAELTEPTLAAALHALGAHAVKGKRRMVEVYGLPAP